MKSTSSFKLSKSSKVLLSHVLDNHVRGFLKRKLIEVEMISQAKVKSSREDRSRDGDSN